MLHTHTQAYNAVKYACVCGHTSFVCMRVHTSTFVRPEHAESFSPTVAAGLDLKFLVCINVLYVLVPVLVHVLLDGSGHDSAEIDGTVERHATSAPTKQPVPAPRHSTRSSIETDLEFGEASEVYCRPYSLKYKTNEQSKPLREGHSPEKSSPKSKIPVKVKKSMDNETTVSKTITSTESKERKTLKSDDDQPKVTIDSLATRSIDLVERSDKLFEELSEEPLGEKEARQLEEDKEKSDSIKPEVSDETRPTTETADTRDNLFDSEKFEQIGETVKKVETVTVTTKEDKETDLSRPDKFVTTETTIVENLPSSYDSATRTTISKVQRSVTDEVVSREIVTKTVTTVRCFATESIDTEQTGRIARAMAASGDYGDIPMPVVKGRDSLPFNIEQLSAKIIKSTTEMSEPWAHGSLTDRSFLNDEKVEQWESQLSQDTSPSSGNGDMYTKNGSSRHDLNSDTESDDSPRSRRRSPSKRCTLGSSSGSDVALHEGAELSPLEDDQGTALTANLLSKQCTYPANQVTRETVRSENVNFAVFCMLLLWHALFACNCTCLSFLFQSRFSLQSPYLLIQAF